MACSSHSSRMPCSARKPSKDEPTLPFLLFVISEHLLHTLERGSQALGRRLLRFLDKAVQQHHAFRAMQKITRPIFPSVRSLRTSHRPLTIGHAERPAEFDFLNVPT